MSVSTSDVHRREVSIFVTVKKWTYEVREWVWVTYDPNIRRRDLGCPTLILSMMLRLVRHASRAKGLV